MSENEAMQPATSIDGEVTNTAVKSGSIALVEQKDAAQIATYKGYLDPKDAASVLGFGSTAQKAAAQLSEQMVAGVKSKDAGPIGEKLVTMVTQMRGLDFSKAKGENKVGFFGKLLGKVTPLAEFVQSYEDINTHIGVVIDQLEQDKVTLAKSVKSLDLLYDAVVDAYHDLSNYIAAGEEYIADLDTNVLPKMREAATASGDLLDAQNLNDMQSHRDAVERKVANLKLSRQVNMNMIPTVRIVQTGDNDIIAKIDDQLLNSIPLWRQQLAIAVEMWKQATAVAHSKAVDDYQNELLVKNAQMLRQGNAAVIAQRERGIYDVAAVETATNELIGALEDSAKLTKEGREKRAAASVELTKIEGRLKDALRNAATA
jgi:uncharacterized protein YaaN involved in tellurite resistance